MDLLFKRYASPFLLVDQILTTGQFSTFVTEIFDYNTDDRLWDIFLHKVDGKISFDDWKTSIGLGQDNDKETTENRIETTINDSFDILNGFEPTS